MTIGPLSCHLEFAKRFPESPPTETKEHVKGKQCLRVEILAAQASLLAKKLSLPDRVRRAVADNGMGRDMSRPPVAGDRQWPSGWCSAGFNRPATNHCEQVIPGFGQPRGAARREAMLAGHRRSPRPECRPARWQDSWCLGTPARPRSSVPRVDVAFDQHQRTVGEQRCDACVGVGRFVAGHEHADQVAAHDRRRIGPRLAVTVRILARRIQLVPMGRVLDASHPDALPTDSSSSSTISVSCRGSSVPRYGCVSWRLQALGHSSFNRAAGRSR